MTTKAKSFLIGGIAFAAFAAMRNVIPLHNMMFFVAACIVFAGVALVSYLVMNKKQNTVNPVAERIWSILAIVLLGGWIVLFYMNEMKAEHPLTAEAVVRSFFPFPLWITLMIVGVAVCLFILRKDSTGKLLKIRKILRAVVSVLFTAGTSIQFYAPNIFQDIQGGTYHSHAYTNSILMPAGWYLIVRIWNLCMDIMPFYLCPW